MVDQNSFVMAVYRDFKIPVRKYLSRMEERMMKASIIKKMLTGALALSLVMAPAMSAGAASSTVPSEESSSSESTSSEASTPVAEIPASSTVAGTVTTTSGTYLAKSVSGSAVATSVANIAAGYGLASNETPYAKFSDMDPKKSTLAKAAIDQAALSQGAEVGPMLNIEFGKMTAGKYSLLPSDGAEIRVALGVPKKFADAGKTFAVVRVQAGGVVSILPDVDDNPNTVTFDTTGGAAAYAIIKY